MSDSITLFDRLLAQEIPADIVYEDEHILAFRDIHPQAPVHVLVIPKIKQQSFDQLADISPELCGQLFTGVARVARELGLAENGYRVVINHGRDGQQTVEYIHAHLLAGRQMQWPPG
ncbi:histidine triad nucleotide-binding protein [bacterium (Candidatus Blackallbacteria) CG17_big_fil_post_rev_8_21_14_2_50_48_46]|uniref:Histidine triad nucleotide-binding protein n=1 Tax=bacterium (Candidatus Blackallbacteria) CG17_big_fil_post_rev_8_21_14_2_50_48_46 TaxID=2014261 RepID=A0A2M7FZE4_9BACT|nr:MAG: histidine triad nucleotide-binding protein [bacterium (Candidatus Blackallbacteria) CG18_big_fil_WC_8_21_14_2_50_49_26]PIW14764.1 MAG: histidine triad nucleotide-binding protein [bacterium (Candidatus Blackallbacteria) CG17_big_fil_post_rev_8_21_14_2_50_48_46]PIW50866.1 MAG: histidine triad nucleotide-binding protein [bacterium (Candidatus Blackallbacteria) CG13_big_fil_rev_8_21_14_2_50_49_14]